MRIITRALGFAAGAGLVALFLYLGPALHGVTSDRDSIVVPMTMLGVQR